MTPLAFLVSFFENEMSFDWRTKYLFKSSSDSTPDWIFVRTVLITPIPPKSGILSMYSPTSRNAASLISLFWCTTFVF